MIGIKAKDDLYNYNNVFNMFIHPTIDYEIYSIRVVDNYGNHHSFYETNKEVVEKVYNIIQNQIIELNAKNENGCIDVEAIIKEVENGNSF